MCKLASVVLQAGGTLGMQCKYMCVYCTVCLSKTITVCVCTLFFKGWGVEWGVCVCGEWLKLYHCVPVLFAVMDALQIRVDSCSVLVQSDALTSILPPNFTSCSVPTCGPALPPITPGHTPVSAYSSTVLHSSTGSSVSGMSLRHFIQVCT